MEFQNYLIKQDKSPNTILSYTKTVEDFLQHFGELSADNLHAYRERLYAQYQPSSINVKIQALNSYLNFLGKSELKMKAIKIQQCSFLDKVINLEEYHKLLAALYCEEDKIYYVAAKLLGSTGVRISELLNFTYDDIYRGSKDIISKGRKLRRVYIPLNTQAELLALLPKTLKQSLLFVRLNGKTLSARQISLKLKAAARSAGISEQKVYPHSFRHLFAKEFLKAYQDIALLADLMGHEHIETTRIYLRKTSSEQREIVEDVVRW